MTQTDFSCFRSLLHGLKSTESNLSWTYWTHYEAKYWKQRGLQTTWTKRQLSASWVIVTDFQIRLKQSVFFFKSTINKQHVVYVLLRVKAITVVSPWGKNKNWTWSPFVAAVIVCFSLIKTDRNARSTLDWSLRLCEVVELTKKNQHRWAAPEFIKINMTQRLMNVWAEKLQELLIKWSKYIWHGA